MVFITVISNSPRNITHIFIAPLFILGNTQSLSAFFFFLTQGAHSFSNSCNWTKWFRSPLKPSISPHSSRNVTSFPKHMSTSPHVLLYETKPVPFFPKQLPSPSLLLASTSYMCANIPIFLQGSQIHLFHQSSGTHETTSLQKILHIILGTCMHIFLRRRLLAFILFSKSPWHSPPLKGWTWSAILINTYYHYATLAILKQPPGWPPGLWSPSSTFGALMSPTVSSTKSKV